MKISRKQLRRLILNEVRIKPSIPNASKKQYSKIQDLARDEDPAIRNQADSLADALGYEPEETVDIWIPEPKTPYNDGGQLVDFEGQLDSFSDELRRYDNMDIQFEHPHYKAAEWIEGIIDTRGGLMSTQTRGADGRYLNALNDYVAIRSSDLEHKFGQPFSLDDMKGIREILGWPWEIKWSWDGEEYYLEFDVYDGG